MESKVMAGPYEVCKTASRDGVTYEAGCSTLSVKIFVNWDRYESPGFEERFLEVIRQAVTSTAIS